MPCKLQLLFGYCNRRHLFRVIDGRLDRSPCVAGYRVGMFAASASKALELGWHLLQYHSHHFLAYRVPIVTKMRPESYMSWLPDGLVVITAKRIF